MPAGDGRPDLVLFDLDGTLVDSAVDLAAAADEMLAALGRAPLGEARVRGYVGDGIERLVHRCLTGDLHADADTDRFGDALALFMEAYQRHNGRHGRAYPGVREALDALAALGVRMGCVTNKSRRFTEPLLVRLGLRDRFQVVVSGDTATRKKPDPAPLRHALDTLGLPPSRALLVGDSDNDVRAARAAGMPVVCVSYGYNRGRDIARSAPDAVFDSLAELPAWLCQGRPRHGRGAARAS